MSNVLVTGGAGYIGAHACKALAAAGYRPVSYDNLVYGHRDAVKWGPLEEGDILDPVRMDELFSLYQPIAVLHFAAFAYVGESVVQPLKYWRNNVAGSLSLLASMARYGVDKIVFSSSCATYGLPRKLPLTEDHPREPVNPYGRTKLVVENMLMDCAAAHQLRSISLRYFNAAGADPEGEIGESHDPETHLIPLLLQTAAGTRSGVEIYGDDYDTPDGTCIRDYIHVTDLAAAHVLALQALEQGAESTAYNLGNDRGYSVREVVAVARAISGEKISVVTGKRRPGDPPVLVSDSARIGKELGWKPRFTNLEPIIDSAWNWVKRKPAPARSLSDLG